MIAPADPVFLDLDDVLLIHEEQLARYGGGAGIRDAGLFDSAGGTPRATFGGDFVHEAVVLLTDLRDLAVRKDEDAFRCRLEPRVEHGSPR